MTELEKAELLQTMCERTLTATEMTAFLAIAKNVVLNRMYPFGVPTGVTEVPARYAEKQVIIACFLLNKVGAEGETVHNENGINRTYGGADVPADMLKEITPFVGVI